MKKAKAILGFVLAATFVLGSIFNTYAETVSTDYDNLKLTKTFGMEGTTLDCTDKKW